MKLHIHFGVETSSSVEITPARRAQLEGGVIHSVARGFQWSDANALRWIEATDEPPILAGTMQFRLGSARVSRARAGVPPTSRWYKAVQRLVHDSSRRSDRRDADASDRDGRVPHFQLPRYGFGGIETREYARPTESRRLSGFTMIELIGVLAVIAILAAVLIPTVIRRMDRAAWERETQDLNTLAQGLVQSIRTERRIPAGSGFADAIANYRNLARSQVKTNSRRFERVFLLDPNLNIGGNNLLSTAFIQSNTGATNPPISTRVLLLSTLAQPPLTNASSSAFNEIWNAIEGSVPPSLGSRKADDLKIQRLDLANLFHKLHLQNVDTNQAWYTLDTNAPSGVAPLGSSLTVYLLDGTGVNLYAGNTNSLQLREILTEDRSFIYQNGTWSGELTTPKLSTTLGPYGNLVAAFLAAGTPVDPFAGATPQAAIESFYNYMVDYIVWSRGDPAHGIPIWQGAGQNQAPQFPYYRLIGDAQGQLDNVSGNLIK